MILALPAAGYLEDGVRTQGEMKQALEDMRDFIAGQAGGAAEGAHTIASGAITPTTGLFSADTEAAAAADNLDNIVTTNLPDGFVILLRGAAAVRVVTVRHNQGGAGQIATADAASIVLDARSKWIMLKRTGADWEEIARFGFSDPTSILESIIEAKGDVVVGAAAESAAVITVGTDGQVLTADAAEPLGVKWAILAAAGGGKILQVVSVTTAATSNTNSATFQNTALTATITPSSATSKILVLCTVEVTVQSETTENATGQARISRGATPIGGITSLHSVAARATNPVTRILFSMPVHRTLLDSPATTSATTYTAQIMAYAASSIIYFNGDGQTSHMVLMEVEA